MHRDCLALTVFSVDSLENDLWLWLQSLPVVDRNVPACVCDEEGCTRTIPNEALDYVRLVLDLLHHPPHPCIVEIDFFKVIACCKEIFPSDGLTRAEDSPDNLFFGSLNMNEVLGLARVPDSEWVVLWGRSKRVFAFRTVKRKWGDACRMLLIVLQVADRSFRVVKADGAIPTTC